MELLFRRNVAAILRRGNGQILVAERVGVPGAWQFPQGGVDDGEDDEAALFREVEEELGIRKELMEIADRKSGYRYTFPDGRIKHGKYHGQQQVYFLCNFFGADSDIALDRHHPEFGAFRWIDPHDFDLDWVPKFKQDVYRAVLQDFFGAGE